MNTAYRSRGAIIAAAMSSVAFALTSSASASILGSASDFNAFIFGNINYQNSDFEGRVAAGGNVSFTNMGVGSQLPNSNGALDHMIVGGNVNWTNGQVFGGNLSYGGTSILSGVGFPNGSAYQAAPSVNFAAEQAFLNQSSTFWSGLAGNGLAENTFGSVALTGFDSSLNVFNLDGAWLAGANGLSITAPTGSTVLINVSGAAAQMQNFGFFLSGITSNNILFNFYEATTLNMSGIGIEGSILAPLASVTFANGQMNGTLIAESLTGSGELHHRPFGGDLPQVPAPATLALFGLMGLASRRRR
ncbi:MAG TPA: choice-of-anchor A family protein [Phycisphaerales bacterium]|nr:choice-of-anchor A family protein [Phycisphaerales bacterium]